MRGIVSYCRSFPAARLALAIRAAEGDAAGICLRVSAASAGVEIAAVAAPGRRHGAAARARHLAIYLAHVVAGLSQRDVARRIGCHPSTVGYALARIEEARETAAFDAAVAELEEDARARLAGRVG